MKAWSRSKSRGLFAGASIKGASLQIDKDANNTFYGQGLNAKDIFKDKELKAPPVIEKLRNTLEKYTSTHS
jgi:lipid-binding SYLF domain-containing protein